MPLLCTVNEGWLVGGWFKVRDLPETAALYEEWKAEMAARHGPGFMRGSLAPSAVEANCWQDNSAATWLFMAWAQQRGHRRQAEFLKSLGVKALLTAGNHGPNNAPNQDFRIRLLDYVDTHWYVDHPDFPQGGWGLPSACRPPRARRRPTGCATAFSARRRQGRRKRIARSTPTAPTKTTPPDVPRIPFPGNPPSAPRRTRCATSPASARSTRSLRTRRAALPPRWRAIFATFAGSGREIASP